MLRKLLDVRLGVKIFGGFGMILVLLAIIAGVGVVSLSMIANRWQKSDTVDDMVKTILEVRRHEKNYVIRGDMSYVKQVDDLVALFRTKAELVGKQVESQDERNKLGQAVDELGKYISAFHLYVDSKKGLDAAMIEMGSVAQEINKEIDAVVVEQKSRLDDLLKFDESTGGIAETKQKLEDGNRIQKWFLEARSFEKEFFATADKKLKTEVEARMDKLLNLSRDLRPRFKQQANVERIDKVISSAQGYTQSFAKCEKLAGQTKAADDEMVRSARAVQEVCDKARQVYADEMSRYMNHGRFIITTVSGLTLLIGLLMAFFLTLAITKPLKVVIDGLASGAEQVSGASGHISSTSQHLAEGASQQAAAIEQTSAAMEEMASMTKQSADNANQANHLMGEAKGTVTAAGSSMTELMDSMSEISKASEETSKIVKTIDEIAFQTNLLALNAAVEAARAGEAGAGFAVVADEVRNLAMRAADAARNTSELIEATVVKINGGSAMVGRTSQDFSKVVESSTKMASLVNEIASASSEQAQGIEQISNAINEMDRVIQQNAADAEQSAATSQELSAQAVQMQAFVKDLEEMVSGHGEKMKMTAASRPQPRAVPRLTGKAAVEKPQIARAKSKPARSSNGRGTSPTEAAEQLSAEKVIPFDEKDLDF